MKTHILFRVRKLSWVIAALFLIAFCWLGFLAASDGALFKGLKINFPTATKLAVALGPVAFPMLGIATAATFLLSDLRSRSRRIQLALTILFALLAILAARALLMQGSFMGPATQQK